MSSLLNPISTTIVISEVEADPILGGTDSANEWFELRNVGLVPVTLTGWTISDATSSDTIPTVTIGVGGHVIVAATSAGFTSEHAGFGGTVLVISDGEIGNGLANAGDVLTLRDNTNAAIDCVSWGTNTTCFTPSVAATAANTNVTLQRTGLVDTDTAADWTNNTAETPDGTTNYGIVYTWAPPAPGLTGDYQVPANWDPDRLTVNITPADVLVVSSGTPTTTIDNIPTETIAQFRFTNATATTLETSGTNTLTIAGAAGTDFDVSGSSQVTLSGTNTLTVRIGAGATGNIDNLLSFAGTGGSRLIATDAGAVTFPTATNCTALAGYTGNPFGTIALGAGAGSIVFQSGSTYTHQSGDSPFGAAGDSQIVNFQSGSTARWFTSSGFQASGRTYADLEIGNGTTAVSVSDTGTGNFQFENLTVKAAGANNSSLTYTGTGSAAVTIAGNISSTGIGTGTAQDINLIAPGGITINKPASSITFGNDGSNARALNLDGNVTLTNTTTLTLSRIVLLGQANPNSKTFTVSPTGTLNGGSTGYIIGGLKKNFTGSALSRTFEIGTAVAYTPINLTFAEVTTPGDITANTFFGDHADTTAGTSGIDKDQSVNEYWNLTKDGSIVFSTYDATFNFTAGLLDGGVDTNAFIVRKKDGVWTSPTVGTKTATSTQATGMSSMSDFAVGEPLPEVSVAVSPSSVLEDGAGNLDYTFTRTGDTTNPLTVNFDVLGSTTITTEYSVSGTGVTFNTGTATGSVIIPAGSATATVTVDPTADTDVETDETVKMTVAAAAGYIVGTPSFATGTFTNDDTNVTVEISTSAVVEDGALNLIYTFTRTPLTPGAITVNFTVSGTADSSTDYAVSGAATFDGVNGTVIIPAANTEASVTVDPTSDTTFELNETVIFTVTAGTGYNVAPTLFTVTGTITNDDVPPTTLAVNTTNDVDDGLCNVAHCSLREAINAANFSTDTSTINFNIPNTDPGFVGPGVFLIRPTSAYNFITGPTMVDGASQTVFTGDTNVNGPEVVIRGDLAGTGASGLFISGDNSTIKDLVVNGFNGTGLVISYNVDSTPTGNALLNNYVGTNADGTVALGNGGGGISLGACFSCSNTISNNLISSNSFVGIGTCDASNSTISNNKIGTDRTGTLNLGNGGPGILFQCSTGHDNTISGNTIAFNSSDGFRDLPDYRFGATPHFNNRLTQNSIFSNGGLGINLNPPPFNTVDGVTPNDNQDPDTGGNHLQNFPVITSAKVTGTTYKITGTLNTTPNSTSGYTIEFFKNTACDGSGNGEGQTYLGSVVTGNTNASGDVAFTFYSPIAFAVGEFITATAADVNGSTSEFSACHTAVAGTPGSLQFAVANTNNTETNSSSHTVDIAVTRTGGSDGAVSVDYQVTNGTATTADNDYSISPSTGTLNWADGDTANKLITITVNGDTVYEANETVNLALSNAQVASLGSPSAATLTITNDDAPPATLAVNTTNDVDDGLCSVTHCSLREAINAANFSADTSTINFNIPNTDPGFAGGVFTIQPTTQLPTITQRVNLDGATQTTFTGDTNVNGPEVVINGGLLSGTESGLITSTGAASSVISNLVVNGFTLGTGIAVWSSNTQVLNNYLGTNAAGTAAVANAGGLAVGASAGVTTGYTISGNLISGNTGGGIGSCDITSSIFSSNKIGTDRLGTGNVGNGGRGISTGCSVWGSNTISGNTIAFNNGDGWRDDPDYRFGLAIHLNNRVTQNSFHSNAGLGINLSPPPFTTVDGVTPNDNQDPDEGGNHLQNFPVITGANAVGLYPISGTLNTTPNSTSGYTIEFFKSTACDGSGNGEGQTYLGSVLTGNTDASGDVAFSFNSPVTFALGDIITATATDVNGSTSEFSACFTATANTPPVWITTSATVSEPSGTEANPIQRTATLQVSEAQDGQSLTFSLVGTGQCGANPMHPFTGFSFSPNPVTSAAGDESTNMSFNVGANDAGTHCVRVAVDDGFGAVTQDIAVTVTAANSDPTVAVVDGDDAITVSEPSGTQANTQTDFPLSGSDFDSSQTLSFTVETPPTCSGGTAGFAGASIVGESASPGTSPNPSSVTANLRIVAGPNDAGTYCIRVRVSDGAGGTAFRDVTLTITAANSSPVANNDAYSADENGTLSVSAPGVLTNDTDADTGQTRTAVQVSGPAHASSFTLSPDGSFTYTPVAGYAGPDTFTYLARDNSGDGATQDSNTATVNITVNPTACTPAPTDMVAWYPGDNSARDIQGPTFEHGSLQNGATFAAGRVDQAFSFDGVDAVVETTNEASFDFDRTSAFTIDAWIKTTPKATGNQFIVAKQDLNSSVAGYIFSIFDEGSDTLVLTLQYSPTEYLAVSGSTDIIDGQWHHVAAVYDGSGTPSGVKLYVDGALESMTVLQDNLGANSILNDAPLTIGTRKDNQFNVAFNGQIDEVEIFNRALAETEVQPIAGHTSFGKCRTCTAPPANLRNWWDGSGTGTTANDIAGPNPGTLQGTAAFGLGKVGQGFLFDGTSGGAVSITYASGFPSSANGVTIDAWIKLDSFDSADGIFSAVNTAGGGGANDIRLRLMTNQNGADGNLYGQVRRPGGYNVEVTSGPVLRVNTWHHVAMTASSSTEEVKIYVDGVLVGSRDELDGPLPTDVNRVFIGSGEQSTVFNVDGSIDEVQVFNRTLLPAEIIAIADAGNAGKCHTSTVQFSSPTYTVPENIGSGNATITVTRTGALDSPASVSYSTVAGGTATAGTTTCAAGDDYLSTSGIVNFAANDASETFTVPICNDATFEPNETVNLQLSSPSVGVTLGTPSSAVLTITNAEDPPEITIDDVTLAEGDSGTTNFVFTVTKTGNTELTATVNYTTANATAIGGVACGPGIDYESTSGTLTFDPNETTETLTVRVCGDTVVEPNELFIVSLSGGTNRVIADFNGDGNIVNDDTEVTLTVSPAAVFEDNTPNLVYTFTRNLTTAPLTVNFSIGGTATFGPNPGDDYTQTGATTFAPPNGTVTFATGSATATVIVDPTLDATAEVDETVVLTIASGAGYSIAGPNQATGTIRDDDAAPTLLVVRETNLHGWVPTASGTASTSFVVGPGTPPIGEGSGQLSVGSDGSSAAQFRQPGFNGTLLSDLSRLRYGSYTSNDGSVPTTGDQSPYIILNIDFDNNGTQDDQIFFEPEYQHGYTAVVPDQGDNVLNTWQTWDALIGGWWSLNGTAGAGQGANVKPLSAIIAAQPNARILSSVNGNLRFVAGFGAGSWDNFVGNIDDVNVGVNNVNTRYDFEPLPRISIDNVTAAEGNAGPTSFTFNVTLSRSSDDTITVSYTTADNTAKVADSDYQTQTDTLTFNPGETSKPVTITVNGDTKLEPDETFFVDLSTPTNAVILQGRGVGTVQNDDNATSPTFSIDSVTMAEGNAGTTNFIFTVTKTGVTGIRSRVDFATADGTTDPASGGVACGGSVDYVSQSGTLTFNPSETTKQITIAVCGETTFEPNEPFFVNLSNPVNGSITSGQGTGTITNEDCAAFSTVYVDDDWVGTTFMADPDGLGPATSFGCDSFATIQGGINGVQPGGTVIVATGTYTENLTLAKQVTLQGAQFGVNACGRSATESTITAASGTLLTLQAGSASSIIDGFTFSGGARGIESAGGPLNNLQIRNNRVLGFTGNGIFLNDLGTDITVHQNSIDGGSKTGTGALFHLDQDLFPGFHFTNNCITGKGATDTSSGFFVDGDHNVGVSTRTPLISGNTIINAQTGMNLGRFAFTGAASTNNGTISNNTFSNNLFDGLQGGIQNTTISGNTFSGNGRHGLALTGFSGTPSADSTRGAINTLVLANTITGNGFVNAGAGISFNAFQFAGTIATNEAHFNRIVGNATGAIYNGIETINLEKNWWGCNYGPGVGGTGCTGTPNGLGGTGAATLDANPWVILGVTASPTSVTPGGSSAITADMTDTNAGADNVTTVPLPDAQFTATNGTILPSSDPFTAGLADSTFQSTSNSTGSACATVDGQQVCATITINLPSFSISDASVTEGDAGTANLVFTVTKTGPGAAAVNFQTQDVSATIGNNDYQTNSGPLVFASSDTTKTITVLVNGDTTPEAHEILNVILSSPTDATISDNTGVGTIFNDDESVSAGQLIISEFRLSGPGANPTAQANNEFIELYNNTDQDLFVATTDGSAGWAVATSSGVEVFNVPNGTVIKARAHFLGTNTTGYSLNTYPAGVGTFATGDATWITDVPDNTALAVFRTNNNANFNTTNRLDAVGPNTESNTLYREGAGYAPLAPSDLALNLEHTFFRQICVFQAGCPTPGRPRDTQDNAADFIFADTTGAGTSAGQRLGAPGPENSTSPIKRDPAVNLLLLDATVGDAFAPNRDRNPTSDPSNASQFGTMTIRRRVVNLTGGNVTRLRFRVIDMTTHPSGVFADLRLRSSSTQSIGGVNDPNTCASTGTPTAPACTVNVMALTLEQPPNQESPNQIPANGGGLNSTVTLPLSSPLLNGQSVNVNFLLGVQKTGQFKFYLVIEALP